MGTGTTGFWKLQCPGCTVSRRTGAVPSCARDTWCCCHQQPCRVRDRPRQHSCTKPFSCALCPREEKPVSELPLTGEESKAFLFSPSRWVPGTQPTRSYPHTADTGWNMRVNSGLAAIQVRSFVQHQLIHIQSDPISSLVSFVQTIRRTAWPSYPFTAPKNRG